MKSKVWRYSRWDAVLVLAAAAQLGATIAWAFAFASLPWAWNLAIFPVMALLFYFNPIVVVHNFLHCSFFTRPLLNRAFAVLNSANLGLPQVLYKHHHITHHRFGNDPIENGTTRDPSSTFRFGKHGKQEHWISYSAMSLFRDGTSHAYAETMRRGDGGQLAIESVSVVVALAALLAIDWRWFVFAYLPLFFVGWFLAHTENYFEHFHATDPHSRFANSVSYYPRWYNRLMFNEGYHQEHHIEAGRHWTERPAVRERFKDRMAAANAYQARFPPLLGFLD
jgi:fatty acid desaturase